MPTLKTAVETVSIQLNDQEKGFEYTRWPLTQLIEYANEALIQVSLHRPDAFTTVTNVQLQPGVQQSLPAGVTGLASVLSNNDPQNPLAVMRDDIGLVRTFNKKLCNYELDCSGNVVYKISSYSYDPRTPGYFYVSPPVPAGMNPAPSLPISAVTSPPTLDSTSWFNNIPVDTKYYNAILAWMLSKAYEVDTESETSFRQMQYQRNEFYRMLGIKYTMESKYNSGWYLGQRGYESNVRGQN